MGMFDTRLSRSHQTSYAKMRVGLALAVVNARVVETLTLTSLGLVITFERWLTYFLCIDFYNAFTRCRWSERIDRRKSDDVKKESPTMWCG